MALEVFRAQDLWRSQYTEIGKQGPFRVSEVCTNEGIPTKYATNVLQLAPD